MRATIYYTKLFLIGLALGCLSDAVISAPSDGTITLGISITVGDLNAPRVQQGIRVQRGLNLWLNKINSTVTIRGQPYRFVLRVLEDNGTIPSVLVNYEELLDDPSIDYILGPIGSDASNPVANLTEQRQRFILGTSVSSRQFFENNTRSLSVVTTAARCPLAGFPYFRLQGAKRIAFIVTQATNTREACGDLTDLQAQTAGMQVVTRYNLSTDAGNVTEEAKKQISSVIQDLKTRAVDVVFACAFGKAGKVILEEMRAQNYSPGFISFFPLDLDYDYIEPNLSNYITGCARFDPSAIFPSDPIFGDTKQFVRAYEDIYGIKPDDYAAFGAITGELLQLGLTTAESFSDDHLVMAIERVNMNTFMGQLFFGVDHSNRLSCVFVQIVNGTRVVIGPPLAQFEDNRAIYPFPAWQDRNFVREFNGFKSEWVFFALALFFSVASFAFIIYTAVHRKSPIIKASSPNLLFAFLIGSILLYSSLFTWTLTNVTTAGCYMQSWLLSFGFTIMFGLSSAKSLRIFKITDAQLLYGILIALAGDAIICIVQVAVVDMTPVMVIVDPHRPILNYEECPFNDQTIGIAAALIGYNAIICAFGLAIAWKIRHLKYHVYNESKIIAFSMYNVVFFAIIVIVLQFTRATGRELLYILRSTGILLGASVSVATMFITKLKMKIKRSRANTAANSSNHSVPPVPAAGLPNAFSQSGLEDKEREIERLKMKLLAKKSKMRQDEEFYQKKYADLYHENMTLKNLIESKYGTHNSA